MFSAHFKNFHNFPYSTKPIIPMLPRLLALFFSLSTSTLFAQSPLQITSPDNNLQLSITENGIVQYALAYKGKSLVQPSSVGMKLNRPEISLHEFEVLGHSQKTVDETWKPLFGEKSKILTTS